MTEMEKQALMEIKEDYCKRNCKYTPAEQEVMCDACGVGCVFETIEDVFGFYGEVG